MILDIMVFMLGVLTAGLLAMAFLPAIWRRAVRLSTARLAQLVPLSAAEIAAERDHIRAAHAVELRRAEQKLERVEVARATLMAEGGRLAARIATLEREGGLARQEIAALKRESGDLRWDFNGLQAESGAAALALHAATDLAQRRWLEAAVLDRTRQDLEQQVDRNRGSIAALETRLIGSIAYGEGLEREIAALGERLSDGLLGKAAVEAERDLAREAAATRAVEREHAEARLKARDHEIDTLSHELAFMAEQAASAERRAADATMATEKAAAARADEDRRRATIIEQLRAERAALEVALAAARADEVVTGIGQRRGGRGATPLHGGSESRPEGPATEAR